MTSVIWVKSSYCGEAGACVEVAYRKSSRSGPYSDNCVEVAYRKSSKSSRSAGTELCVEVADSDGCDLIHVRDSKDPTGPVLNFSRGSWWAFIDGIRRDEFR